MTFGVRQASAAAVLAFAFVTSASIVGSPASDAMSKPMAHGKTKIAMVGAAAVSYSPAQASTGLKAYGANCSSCHGEKLEGGVGPALSGATLNTLSKNTHLTVGDMFTFLSQQMPLNAPASLTKKQYAAIMAYVLKFNGYPAGSKELTYAGATDSKVIIRSK